MNTLRNDHLKIHNQAKALPNLPGVYLFKDQADQILYIGKAKKLKTRVSSYFKNQDTDWKNSTIVASSSHIEHIITKNELEAMLLEAQLIQANQPKFNVLLKSGQPFLYLMITSPKRKLPELKLVRNKKEKGSYFGPFLEKTPARIVYDFLTKTLRLKLCKKKIETGCLEHHMGLCAGNCRPDFDAEAYKQRLELAKIALQKGHQKFLKHLQKEIDQSNQNLKFEKSKELHQYLQAFQKVFDALNTTNHPHSPVKTLATKDIWILSENKKSLFLFSEKGCALKQKKMFCFPFNYQKDQHLDYFTSYYRSHIAPNMILVNFEIDKKEKELFEQFLKQWHKKDYDISITKPKTGHFASLVNLATIQMQQELKKQKSLPKALKTLLKLSIEPKTIDCFDISHKQGMFMVGSCIKFKDGKPDKDNFRRFKIKTVDHQDDYSCLQEIVKRRYSNKKEIPDLILIDGGKGQLSAITKILPNANVISLAKREETIFSPNLPMGKKLNPQNYASLLLIALRDYAHHFAINYHRKLAKF